MIEKFLLVGLAFLGCFMKMCCCYDNGVAAEPPKGWSSWCTNDLCGIPDFCSEHLVKEVADAFVEQGLVELGYKWLLLDDCWSAKDRDENGELQPNKLLFPHGMEALSEYVHERGLKLGLYTCIGTKTCKRDRPGSYGYYETDANTMAKWNIDMVKMDYCYKPNEENGQELYTQMSNALNATGRPILFSLCNWGHDNVEEWGGDIAQAYRVQMDHLPFYQWPPTASGEGYGCGTKNIIDWMADLHPSKYTRQHAWMDPDFLETLFEVCIKDVCTTMDFTASRTEFAFWSLWSSPLMFATTPMNMTEEKKSILMNKEVLAIHNDPLYIAGERIYNSTTGAQAWQRPLENGDIAVILFNSGHKRNVEVGVTWKQLGLDVEEKRSVRDLWKGENLGEKRGGIMYKIEPKDHLLLRLSKV